MPSLSHKQTELCICGNVVLYINSASYIAEMVLQLAMGDFVNKSFIIDASENN
jgi:hypothetical protein